MPVTLPPVIYDLASPARDDFNVVNHFIGPFEYSTPNRQYTVLRCSVFGNSQIRVYKSLDAGATWAIMDQANGPPDSAGYDVTELAGVIHVVYQPNAGGGLRHIAFDTATDTWGAIVAGGPTPFITFRSVIASTGVIRVLFPTAAGPNNKIQFVGFAAGVWSAAADFTTAAATVEDFLQNAHIDAADLIHVYYDAFDSSFGGSWALFHRTLSLGGVVGAASTITNTFFANATVGRPTILGTQLVAPTFTNANPALAAVFVSTDLTGTAWSAITTVDLVPAVAAGGDDSEVFALNDGTSAIIFWIALDYTNPGNVIDRLYYSASTDLINWSNPVFMYDAVTNPQTEDPAVDPVDQDLHTLSVAVLLSGKYGIYSAMEENSFCAGYALLDTAGVLPPSIVCDNPPNGTVGTPYSHFFPASGGTLPYTFAIIAGALPDGLTLDASTGEVSGTPTLAGLFTFTVQVTDDDANTAEVECSITINPAGDLLISCNNPPNGKVGVAYSHTITASGGVPPYTFSITDGDLPDGLTLDGSTGEISGTPTTKGLFTFTVEVTDNLDVTADVECSIQITGRCLIIQ